MKKHKLYILPLLCVFLFGCANNNNEQPETPQEEEQQQPVNPTPTRDKLATPVLSLNSTQTGIVWDAIEGAVKYSIQINIATPYNLTDTELLFEEDEGQYAVRIIAVADDTQYNSEAATFNYETVTAKVNGLTYSEGAITWTGYNSMPGTGLEYSFGDGEFAPVTGNSVAASTPGLYNFKVTSGYDAQNNKYYVPFAYGVQSILVSNASTGSIVLEDGSEETNADLAQKYSNYKYDGGWKSTTASLSLDTCNAGLTENKCVRVQYWKHSANFKFERKNMTFGQYDTLSFALKGTGDANEKFKIQFAINNDTRLGIISLKGVYTTFAVTNPGVGWKNYSISMDDPGWSIVLGKYTANPAAAIDYLNKEGLAINSFAQLLPYFDTFSILAYCDHDDAWSTTSFYFDDLKLSNTGEASHSSPLVALHDSYVFESDSTKGKLVKQNDNSWLFSFNDGTTPVELTVSAALENGLLHIVSTDAEYPFDALLTTADSGSSFTLQSVTGSAATLLENLKAEQFVVIDDFSSYANDAALQAAYYADYYTGEYGTNSSTVGGNGWDYMTSTDYLKVLADGHDGQGATFKYNATKAMRYTTIGLVDGTAVALGRAKTLSFWTKGLASRTSVFSIRIFGVNQVTPSNQTSTTIRAEKEFSIEAGADWTECTIDLSSTSFASFYGIQIMQSGYKGDATEGNVYVPIDDIYLYNTISPWSN